MKEAVTHFQCSAGALSYLDVSVCVCVSVCVYSMYVYVCVYMCYVLLANC